MTIGRPGIAATTVLPTVRPLTAAGCPAMPPRTFNSTLRIVAAPPNRDTEPTEACARALVPQPLPLRLTDDAVSTEPSAGYATPLSPALELRGTTATGPSVSGARPGCSSANPASARQRGAGSGAAVRTFPAGFGAGEGAVVVTTVVVAAVVVAAVVVAAVVVATVVVVSTVVTPVVVSVMVVGRAWIPPAATPAPSSASISTTTPAQRRMRPIIAEIFRIGDSRCGRSASDQQPQECSEGARIDAVLAFEAPRLRLVRQREHELLPCRTEAARCAVYRLQYDVLRQSPGAAGVRKLA